MRIEEPAGGGRDDAALRCGGRRARRRTGRARRRSRRLLWEPRMVEPADVPASARPPSQADVVAGIALAAPFLLPSFDWRTGFVLGVVCTTDAIAATTIVPHGARAANHRSLVSA